MLINFFAFVVAFGTMEAVAWLAHKYLMHGPLWFLHKSHHKSRQGTFELNDIFILLFAIPSATSIYYGISRQYALLEAVGYGIAAYGFVYFLIHEIFIHRRYSTKLKWKSKYLKKLKTAHLIHHQKRSKKGCSQFGMLGFRLHKIDQE